MNIELDSFCRVESRPVTALGRLFAPMDTPSELPENSNRLRYWSNRPGQNRAETFVLATLITLTSFGLSSGFLIQWIAPDSIGRWLLVGLLIVPGFFAIIHLLIFAASGIESFLHLLGIRPKLPPGHFCGRLFLFLLTLTSVLLFLSPDRVAVLRASAGFWIIIAGMNLGAQILLMLRDLREALISSSSPSRSDH